MEVKLLGGVNYNLTQGLNGEIGIECFNYLKQTNPRDLKNNENIFVNNIKVIRYNYWTDNFLTLTT